MSAVEVNLHELLMDGPISTEAAGDTPEKSLFFADGLRRIDYIITYKIDDVDEDEDKKAESERKRALRLAFLDALVKQDVDIESTDESGLESSDKRTVFIKLHAKWSVLARQAELARMKMPIKKLDMSVDSPSCFGKIMSFPTLSDSSGFNLRYFTTYFDRQHLDLFAIEDRNKFFSSAQRNYLLWSLLLRIKYDYDNKEERGVKALLNHGAFESAYPLHDGSLSVEDRKNKSFIKPDCDRRRLYLNWASPKNFYRQQPFTQIRNYFGEKVGMYFAFLGYYTAMLVPASVVGIITFLYGVITLSSDIPTQEICDMSGVGNITLCPMCDRQCPFDKLYNSCMYSRLTYLFDNGATVFFAMFMSIWATLFLEFWKRQQAGLQYEWDVENFKEEDEPVRPEYEASVRTKKLNPITKRLEPYLPWYHKVPRYAITLSVVLFFLVVVVGTVIAVVIYRIVVMTLLYRTGRERGYDSLSKYAQIATSTTAAIISLVFIFFLSKLYYRIAIMLTKLEQHRTESGFDESVTWKMFIFQFMNYYSTIFYIAFFKGRIPAKPRPQAYIKFLGSHYHSEECGPGGCIVELWLQMIIIMVGKQFFTNFQEILFPLIQTFCAKRKSKKSLAEGNTYTRCEQDYDLVATDRSYLFWEYLELILQFGFVTIFVVAFPPAPLFALLNNIIEIRLDAYKFVTQWRRTVSVRAQDIGSWFYILNMVVKLALFSSALLIAFTSSFVDKTLYYYDYGDYSYVGYVNNSLSVFATKDFAEGAYPEYYDHSIFGTNVTECRYSDYREPPWSLDKYAYTSKHWRALGAKLAFVLIFEHIAFLISACVGYAIPDVPSHIMVKSLRSRYIAQEYIWSKE